MDSSDTYSLNENLESERERSREQQIMAARRHRLKKAEELSSFKRDLETHESKNSELKGLIGRIESLNKSMYDYLEKELSGEKYEKVLNVIQMIRSSSNEELENRYSESLYFNIH